MTDFFFHDVLTTLQNGSGIIETQAEQIEQEIETKLQANLVSLWDVDTGKMTGQITGGNTVNNQVWVAGMSNQNIIYDNHARYIVLGDSSLDNNATSPLHVYRAKPTNGQTVTVLSGRRSGLVYEANGESGTILNTMGKLVFHGETGTFTETNGKRKYSGRSSQYAVYSTPQKGNWTLTSGDADNEIYTGMGNSTITTGSGNDTISAAGFNGYDLSRLSQTIDAGEGNNTIHANGNTTIRSGNGKDFFQLNDFQDVHSVANLANIQSRVMTQDGDKTVHFDGQLDFTAGNGVHIIQQQKSAASTYSTLYQSTIRLGDGFLNLYVENGTTNLQTGNGGGNLVIDRYAQLNAILGNGDYTINILKQSSLDHNSIKTGDGNNVINAQEGLTLSTLETGAGDDQIRVALYSEGNTINAGLGHNTIILEGAIQNTVTTEQGSFNTITGVDKNSTIYSNGQDTIYASNSTLMASGHYSSFTVDHTLILESGHDNQLYVMNGKVIGGHNDSITFSQNSQNTGQDNENQLSQAVNDTVSAIHGASLNVIGGMNNHFTIEGNFTFENGIGMQDATIYGNSHITGKDSLNMNLKAIGMGEHVFNAGTGNETLNGFSSTATIIINATQENNEGQMNSLTASTGSGNDVFMAGMGNATFSGGMGNNLFVFNQQTSTLHGTDSNQTILTDFSISAGNKIELLNYHMDQDGINSLLQSSHNDINGNAIVDLGNNRITFQGISINDLHADQFLTLPVTPSK